MKIQAQVDSVQFALTEKGLLAAMLTFKEHEELKKKNYPYIVVGVDKGHTVGRHFCAGSGTRIELEFNQKDELENYSLVGRPAQTVVPSTCPTCGTELRKKYSLKHIISARCENVTGCTAQSLSPLYRFFKIASPEASLSDIGLFFERFPELQLRYLADLKFLIEREPNTAPRQALWNNDTLWTIEKNVVDFIRYHKLTNQEFWHIGFNIECDLSLETFENDETAVFPKVIAANFVRVDELQKLFRSLKMIC